MNEQKPFLQTVAEGLSSMGKKLSRLIDVKSIVTIMLTGVFSYLAVTGRVQMDQFLTVFTVIIAFYFGTQAQKSADKDR